MSTQVLPPLGSAPSWGCRESVRWVVIQVDVLLTEKDGEEGLNASDGEQSLPMTEVEGRLMGHPGQGPAILPWSQCACHK